MDEQAPQVASGPSAETYFNASRLKVIGLIVAGVVLVGALGGIAGVVFDPDPVPKQGPAAPPVGAPGGGAGQHKSFASPTGIGTLGAVAPTGRGKFIQLDTGVQFWLPRGWRIDAGSQTGAYLSDGKGSYAFVVTGTVNPKVRAGQLLAQNLKGLLPRANYTQLDVTAPQKWAGAYGSVLTSAWLEYGALWVDNQGSAPIYGQIYAAVRQDGKALIILIEHIPPEGFNKAAETGMGPLVSNSYGRFGGVL